MGHRVSRGFKAVTVMVHNSYLDFIALRPEARCRHLKFVVLSITTINGKVTELLNLSHMCHMTDAGPAVCGYFVKKKLQYEPTRVRASARTGLNVVEPLSLYIQESL